MTTTQTNNTTTQTNKDLPMNTTTKINFDFSQLYHAIDPFTQEIVNDVVESLDRDYLNATSLEGIDKLKDTFDGVKDDYYYPICSQIEDIETTISELDALDDQITDAMNNCNFSSIESHLISASHELSCKKREYEDELKDLKELSEFLENIEISLDEMRLNFLENLQNKTNEEDGDEDEDEEEKLTEEEERLAWEGIKDTDIVNLINKILNNKELATHLALEAIKAERFLATPEYNSCPNG